MSDSSREDSSGHEDKTILIDTSESLPSAARKPSKRPPSASRSASHAAVPPPALDPGDTVMMDRVPGAGAETKPRFGEYQLIQELGRGGWGTVYKAIHTGMGRVVALKVVHTPDPTALKRFEREIHMLARLKHSNICPAFDSGVTPDRRPYFVMDYIAGQPLSRLYSARALEPIALARLLAKVCHALHHAHRRGILHRDMKPDNILVDRAGEPHVVDFGIARDQEEEGENLTRVGQVVGTPFYIAPEQVRARELGPHTDIWAVGVLLFIGLAGRPPFRGNNDLETLDRVVRATLTRPQTHSNQAIPDELWAICRRCLEKDPAKRFANAEELAMDLERFVADEPVSVLPNSAPRQIRRWVRQRSWPVQAAVITTIIFVGMAVLGRVLWGALSDAVEPEKLGVARQTVAVYIYACGAILAGASAVALRYVSPRRSKRVPPRDIAP